MLINFLQPRARTVTRRNTEEILQKSKDLRYQVLADQDRFLRKLHPEDFAGTLPAPSFLHRVLAFVRLKPKSVGNPLLTHKIPATKKVEHGLIVPAGFLLKEKFLKEITVSAADILPKLPHNETAIKIDLKHDKALKKFLKSKAVQELKKAIPNENASVKDDLKFLHQLNALTNAQFDKGFTLEEQAELSSLPGKPYDLLGESMSVGIGVCRHRALVNKLVIDQLDHKGLKSSFKTGLLQDLEDKNEPVKADVAHAWNTVTLPSQRKYIVDPTWNSVVPNLVKTKTGEMVKPRNDELVSLKNRYISFNHLLKNVNPNMEWEVEEELRLAMPSARQR